MRKIKKLGAMITIIMQGRFSKYTSLVLTIIMVGGMFIHSAVAQTILPISLHRLASVHAYGYDGVSYENKGDFIEDNSFEELYTFLGASLTELKGPVATPTTEFYSTDVTNGSYIYFGGDHDANADVSNCLMEECYAGSNSRITSVFHFCIDKPGCVNFQATVDGDAWMRLVDDLDNEYFNFYYSGEHCQQLQLSNKRTYILEIEVSTGASAWFENPFDASGNEWWFTISTDCSMPCP